MDILTHSLSGVAIGTALSSYSEKGIKYQIIITMISGLGAALPDLDAISMWSKFDKTFGKVLGLSHKGSEIYFEKYWYSHHGFLHSIFAGVLITSIIGILIYILNKKRSLVLSQKIFLAGLFLGFLTHLLEDIPTPGSVWGGVNLLWPLKSYFGGTGDIWWWNNYDLFVIVLTVVCMNLLIIAFRLFFKFKSSKLITIVCILGLIICIMQIKSRKVDFNYSGFTSKFTELELKSKEVQKQVLGEKLYKIMLWFDNHLPINF